MSSSVTIAPEILIADLLISGIQAIAKAFSKDKQLRDEHGKTHEVDYVFENEAGEKVGVRHREGQPAEFVKERAHSKATDATLNKVRQSYARLKILNEVKKKGYQQVKEEKLADGSIRLVVEKWR